MKNTSALLLIILKNAFTFSILLMCLTYHFNSAAWCLCVLNFNLSLLFCTAHKWYVKTKPVDEEHIKREASDICRNQVDSITDLCDVNTSNERTTSCDHSCDTPPSAAMDMCVTYNCADSRTLEHLSVQSSEEVTTPEDHNNVST